MPSAHHTPPPVLIDVGLTRMRSSGIICFHGIGLHDDEVPRSQKGYDACGRCLTRGHDSSSVSMTICDEDYIGVAAGGADLAILP